MSLISYNPLDVIYRKLDDIIIIKNIRCNEMMTLENVSADIWLYLAQHNCTEFNDIISYIAKEYDTDESEIENDITDFLEELYYSGVIMIDESYYNSDTSSEENNIKTQEDFENKIILLFEEYNTPYSVTFELTYVCNEKCIHCYANYPDESNKERVLDLQLCKNIIDRLFDMNCMHITFTGGDPFMFKGFPELFEYTRKKGFSCDIFTNALYLTDHEDVLKQIISLHAQSFFISLYGADTETHDKITCTPGSFYKTTSAIKNIVKSGIPVILNIMLLNQNIDKAGEITTLAKELKADYRIGISLIYKNDGSDSPMNFFVSDKEKVKKVLMNEKNRFVSVDQSVNYNSDFSLCGAARTSFSIAPDGTVYPCISLKNPLGNVFDKDLSDIWHSEERSKLLKVLSLENASECRNCELSNECPHCIGISQAETGNMFSCNTCDRFLAECLNEIQY